MAKKQEISREDQLIAVGYQAAQDMYQGMKTLEKSYRNTLTQLAEQYHEDHDIEAVCKGVVNYYTEQGYSKEAARTKKSEFKTVLDACKNPGSREHNLQSLVNFEGTYQAFITHARTLRNASSSKPTSHPTGPRKLTAQGAKKVHDAIGRAEPDQLVSMVDDSVKNIVVFMRGAKQSEEATLIGRKLIATIQHTAAALLKTESAEQIFKDAAEQISIICETVLNKTDQAIKDAQDALEKSKQSAEPDEADTEEQSEHTGTEG